MIITFDKNVDSTGDSAANYKIYKSNSSYITNANFKVKRDGVNSSIVYLTLDASKSFQDGDILDLRTQNLKDSNGLNPQPTAPGGVFSTDYSYTFGGSASAIDAIDIACVTPVDAKTIKVLFTKAVDAGTSGTATNYGIGATLAAATVTPLSVIQTTTGDNAYKEVTLRFNSKMTEGSIYYINIKNVKDYVGQFAMAATALGGFASDAAGQTTFSAAGGDPAGLTMVAIIPVDKQTIDVQFSSPMKFDATNAAADADATAANDKNNYSIKTSTGGAFASVKHAMKIDDITVRLFITPTYADGTIYAIDVADALTDTMGTGFATLGGLTDGDDYVTFSALGDDNAAPSITSVSVLDKNTLLVKFSEAVEGLADGMTDGTDAKTLAMYKIFDADGSLAPVGFAGIQAPTAVSEVASDSVTLTFGADFMAGKTYRLVADRTSVGFTDAAGLASIVAANDANFFKFDGIVGGVVQSSAYALSAANVLPGAAAQPISDVFCLTVVGEPVTVTQFNVSGAVTLLTCMLLTLQISVCIQQYASGGTMELL